MITTNPDICSGQPVFTGTRVLVDGIVGQLRSGVSRQELEADFPQISAKAFDWAETLVDGNANEPCSCFRDLQYFYSYHYPCHP